MAALTRYFRVSEEEIVRLCALRYIIDYDYTIYDVRASIWSVGFGFRVPFARRSNMYMTIVFVNNRKKKKRPPSQHRVRYLHVP